MGNVVLCYPSEMRKTIRYHSNTHHLRTSVYCSKDGRVGGDGKEVTEVAKMAKIAKKAEMVKMAWMVKVAKIAKMETL